MNALHRSVSAGLLAVLTACTTAGGPSPAAPPARSVAPTPDELRTDLFVFASDSFGGRETGTPYADKAARWLADRLTKLGLEPAGDTGYFQRVAMQRTSVTPGPVRVTT